jgi:5S rRNA maturation endonuclease (ribonuclease M5)
MDFFDRFEKIYLWLDADEVGKRSAEKFAEVLGSNRTIIIDPTYNSNDSS